VDGGSPATGDRTDGNSGTTAAGDHRETSQGAANTASGERGVGGSGPREVADSGKDRVNGMPTTGTGPTTPDALALVIVTWLGGLLALACGLHAARGHERRPGGD
jgi:hypothetical protein